jgi:hypothetical protein
LANVLSPVLRSVVSGPLAQSCSEYSLPNLSADNVEFALDFCCGDPTKRIGSENALPLLVLANELCLESLRSACSEALVESLVSTNAAQLQEAAERYNAPVLLAAARSITMAASNALGDLIARDLRLHSMLQRSAQLQKDEKANENELRKKIRAVADQRSHEIEELFRRQERMPTLDHPQSEAPPTPAPPHPTITSPSQGPSVVGLLVGPCSLLRSVALLQERHGGASFARGWLLARSPQPTITSPLQRP